MAAERITLDRKDFEAFLAESQALMERVEKLVSKIDEHQERIRQLQKELEVVRDHNVDTRRTEQTIRNTRQNIAHLIEETDKRISR